MEIRKMTEQDLTYSLKLSMYAFQYELPDSDIPARIDKIKHHDVFGIWDGTQLTAKLNIIPFKVIIQNKEWSMGGIAGVATYPEYRRRGYVKALIVHALQQMREQNQIISFLHPFDIAFYRKFGWEILTERKKVMIEKKDLHMAGAISGSIMRFKKDTHHKDIENVYAEYAKQYSGMLSRTKEWWLDNVYRDSSAAVFYDNEHVPKGYILYSVKNNILNVQEMAALDYEARVNLWNFICQHDSMVDSVNIVLPVNDPFPYYLKQPNVKTEVFPYFMARVVDAEKCLESFAFLQTSENVFLHVSDEYADWNNGSYLISEAGVTAYKEKQGSHCAHPPKRGITMNINALSAILTGFQRPKELFQLGHLTGSEKEIDDLEKKIPVQTTFIYDFF
ncbi:GNAT family N-acetyltransferase [Bacillus sp. V33-4]|uniref:GNAT family N-acetyltransferase n=1 Tax=Bacillus sp. V33-4 TaxID=2054169 RepID=UPI000C76A872|nr:GNAT family N-acetyltransferase [Bacillus sp. V33-4]PLR87315.1 GNAT family N-acetyltransferase [Bacillus sp. V33-4]